MTWFRRFLSMSMLLAVFSVASGKDWRGITPLHSTRMDVEKLLGRPPSQGKYVSTYALDTETVEVIYASGPPCGAGLTNSWRVPKDTVLSIRAIPKNELRFDSSRPYKIEVDPIDPLISHYSDKEEGLRYTISSSASSSELVVVSLDYLPTAKDDRDLNCSRVKGNSSNRLIAPVEKYGSISQDRESAILDNFAIELRRNKEMRGFVIVYPQCRKAKKGFAKLRYLRNYLINTRRLKPNRIFLSEGDCSDELLVELYLVPKGLPAPR